MSDNRTQQSSSGNSFDMIVGLIIVIALILLFKYIWNGVLWAFDKYIELLRVK